MPSFGALDGYELTERAPPATTYSVYARTSRDYELARDISKVYRARRVLGI